MMESKSGDVVQGLMNVVNPKLTSVDALSLFMMGAGVELKGVSASHEVGAFVLELVTGERFLVSAEKLV